MYNKLAKLLFPKLCDELESAKQRNDFLRKNLEYFVKNPTKPETQKADLVNATRELLKGIKTFDIDDYDSMSNEAKIQFLEELAKVHTNKSFQKLLDNLISSQVNFSINNAENWGQVSFGRATINGFNLIKEELERYYGEYRDKIKPPEKFNKHDVL